MYIQFQTVSRFYKFHHRNALLLKFLVSISDLKTHQTIKSLMRSNTSYLVQDICCSTYTIHSETNQCMLFKLFVLTGEIEPLSTSPYSSLSSSLSWFCYRKASLVNRYLGWFFEVFDEFSWEGIVWNLARISWLINCLLSLMDWSWVFESKPSSVDWPRYLGPSVVVVGWNVFLVLKKTTNEMSTMIIGNIMIKNSMIQIVPVVNLKQRGTRNELKNLQRFYTRVSRT